MPARDARRQQDSSLDAELAAAIGVEGPASGESFQAGPVPEVAAESGSAPAADAQPSIRAGDPYTYQRFNGAPFVQGKGDANELAMNDVRQGAVGDCFLMASIAAVVQAYPDVVRRLIHPKGGGKYDVTLYVRGVARSVEVDDQFPASDVRGTSVAGYAGTGDKDGDRREIWPMLIEKAYAKLKGGYGAIQGGSVPDGLGALTGKNSSVIPVTASFATEQKIQRGLERAQKEGQPMVAATDEFTDEQAREAKELGLIAKHAYAVRHVDDDRIELYNPHGHTHVTLTVAQAKRLLSTVYRSLTEPKEAAAAETPR